MVWKIKYTEKALRALRKIDKQNARRILNYLNMRVASQENPRLLGKPLKGALGDFWRYRTGDYRILCEIDDGKLVILAATIGHRRKVYD